MLCFVDTNTASKSAPKAWAGSTNDEDFVERVRVHWLDGRNTVAWVDITATEIEVERDDGSIAHCREAPDDPDGMPAYREYTPDS